MDELLKQIDNKRELVRVTRDALKRAIENRSLTSIDRQKGTITKTANEIYEIKVNVQAIRIEKGDKAEDIQTWTENIDQELEIWDREINDANKATTEWKQQEDKESTMREQEKVAEARREIHEEQLEFDKVHFEQKLQHEMKLEKARKEHEKSASTNVKLPKLGITKFNGTPLDWMRFWNLFEAEIDHTDVAPVSKFAYLKELVCPKVRSCIDGLPFSTEGYGDSSEIVNAYVQNIMFLPTIQGSNAGKIHDFYENLLFNVQSLETLGKLKEVNGYVRMCLNKLEGIRGDLVRTDDDWRQWDFIKLVDALRKWTERNPVKMHVHDRSSDKSDRQSNLSRMNAFQARQREAKQRRCVYCNEISHASINCPKIVSSVDRKKYLSEKRLCFNCTGAEHRASDCRSRASCTKCRRRSI